jgi:hypothetical protein
MVLNSVASEHSKRNYAKALPLARALEQSSLAGLATLLLR